MGIGAYRKLPEILNGLNTNNIFLLSDSGVASTDFFKLVEDILTEKNIKFEIFSDIETDPSDKTVEKAYAIYQKSKPSALITLGGGSTIDVGKAVAILATNGGRIHDYEGIDLFANPPLTIIAIPTTTGTGSEVSGSCVITDTTRGLKMSVRSASLNPAEIAILDPLALKTLPVEVATDSGMDAFVHAFESHISLNANPVTDALTLNAIELISSNITPFVSDRSDLDAGLKMLCGASLAGMGFSNTGLGNIHCMARFIGAFFHVSHGLSNAVCLPYGAEFNLTANPDKYARIALAMGDDISGLSSMEAGEKAVKAIWKLCKDIGIPEKLRDIGVEKEKLPEIARLCFEANYNRWNPRYTEENDFLALLEKAW
ncbi:MAG: iron-containing alcohol dehydrogenase [Desulfobacteraceae bacterium]|nr:iron-containing alcohol dehydrogenase [Desulfobacteraceae bacterium]